jgi:GntR family transcriptional regulator
VPPTPPSEKPSDRIADQLRDAIRRGVYLPGHQLPSVTALMRDHGVARQTAQNVYDALRREGLVESRSGAGVFVRAYQPPAKISRRRFVFRDELGYYFDQAAQGFRLVAEPTIDRAAPAPAEIAERLGVEPGSPVVKRSRVLGLLEPEPQGLQCAVSYLPAWLLEELPVVGEADTGLGGIYDRIEEWSGGPLAWEEAQGAVAATAEEAALLHGVVHGGPLVRVLRTATLSDGRPVEVNDTRMDAARFEVVAALERDVSASWPVAPAVEPVRPPDAKA